MITIKKRKLTKKAPKKDTYDYLVKIHEVRHPKLSNELNDKLYDFHEFYDGSDTANNYW
jgi:hypothetical protein